MLCNKDMYYLHLSIKDIITLIGNSSLSTYKYSLRVNIKASINTYISVIEQLLEFELKLKFIV